VRTRIRHRARCILEAIRIPHWSRAFRSLDRLIHVAIRWDCFRAAVNRSLLNLTGLKALLKTTDGDLAFTHEIWKESDYIVCTSPLTGAAEDGGTAWWLRAGGAGALLNHMEALIRAPDVIGKKFANHPVQGQSFCALSSDAEKEQCMATC